MSYGSKSSNIFLQSSEPHYATNPKLNFPNLKI